MPFPLISRWGTQSDRRAGYVRHDYAIANMSETSLGLIYFGKNSKWRLSHNECYNAVFQERPDNGSAGLAACASDQNHVRF